MIERITDVVGTPSQEYIASLVSCLDGRVRAGDTERSVDLLSMSLVRGVEHGKRS